MLVILKFEQKRENGHQQRTHKGIVRKRNREGEREGEREREREGEREWRQLARKSYELLKACSRKTEKFMAKVSTASDTGKNFEVLGLALPQIG